MFVDASAMVAIVTRETEVDLLIDALDGASTPITSAIAILEAALGICRKRQSTVDQAVEDVRIFLATAGVSVVAIGEREADTALAAFARYGKGRGHPAQLNLGDCFAYAVAKNRRMPLLFKGEDFDKTDVEMAVRG